MGQFDKMLERADIQKVGQFIQYESTLNVKSGKILMSGRNRQERF